jgi:50S ribosomal subunit-associated GTPase HflX
MAKTAEQKKAALEQRIAQLKQKVRNMERRDAVKERRDRAHVGIVIGWSIIDYAMANPKSEVRRVAVQLIEAYLKERADDQPVADLLMRLRPEPLLEAAE